jgi:hypothetical protein
LNHVRTDHQKTALCFLLRERRALSNFLIRRIDLMGHQTPLRNNRLRIRQFWQLIYFTDTESAHRMIPLADSPESLHGNSISPALEANRFRAHPFYILQSAALTIIPGSSPSPKGVSFAKTVPQNTTGKENSNPVDSDTHTPNRSGARNILPIRVWFEMPERLAMTGRIKRLVPSRTFLSSILFPARPEACRFPWRTWP